MGHFIWIGKNVKVQLGMIQELDKVKALIANTICKFYLENKYVT